MSSGRNDSKKSLYSLPQTAEEREALVKAFEKISTSNDLNDKKVVSLMNKLEIALENIANQNINPSYQSQNLHDNFISLNKNFLNEASWELYLMTLQFVVQTRESGQRLSNAEEEILCTYLNHTIKVINNEEITDKDWAALTKAIEYHETSPEKLGATPLRRSLYGIGALSGGIALGGASAGAAAGLYFAAIATSGFLLVTIPIFAAALALLVLAIVAVGFAISHFYEAHQERKNRGWTPNDNMPALKDLSNKLTEYKNSKQGFFTKDKPSTTESTKTEPEISEQPKNTK